MQTREHPKNEHDSLSETDKKKSKQYLQFPNFSINRKVIVVYRYTKEKKMSRNRQSPQG